MPKVLVTGAGKRLGRGIAVNFARKGWDVIIHYNSSENGAKEVLHQVTEMGQMATLVKVDLRDTFKLEKVFEQVFKDFGVPSVLVNNAGVFPEERKSIKDMQTYDWDFFMDINAKAHFITSKIFSKYALKGSRIINITPGFIELTDISGASSAARARD
jgi:3-oxoacyl-[acyl-carrier protein] reductase